MDSGLVPRTFRNHVTLIITAMTKTEEYEFAILSVLVDRDQNGRAGMRTTEIKKLFHDLIGKNSEGESFFRYMMEHYMVFRMKDSETIFFPTVLGRFRLRDLENMRVRGKEKKTR
jgi:hypothetical protein